MRGGDREGQQRTHGLAVQLIHERVVVQFVDGAELLGEDLELREELDEALLPEEIHEVVPVVRRLHESHVDAGRHLAELARGERRRFERLVFAAGLAPGADADLGDAAVALGNVVEHVVVARVEALAYAGAEDLRGVLVDAAVRAAQQHQTPP